jgi:hypothetical protein
MHYSNVALGFFKRILHLGIDDSHLARVSPGPSGSLPAFLIPVILVIHLSSKVCYIFVSAEERTDDYLALMNIKNYSSYF